MENEIQEQEKEAVDTNCCDNSNENEKNFIKVIGVGGGGGNAVNHMYEEGIRNVSFVVCNTDDQDLQRSAVPTKIHIGPKTTKGLGCGAHPEIGKAAAEESIEEIKKIFDDKTQMVFITAGMGGGTGTGAAPVIAGLAKQAEKLTVGIVTIPFKFEMGQKIKKALAGVNEMSKNVDALLVINNERLIDLYPDLTITSAFENADKILTESARGIADIITTTGRINVDFADVRTVLKDCGVAVMNSGEATGENRILDGIDKALDSPLLNNNDIRGAQRVLLYVYSSQEHDITMAEVSRIDEFLNSIQRNPGEIEVIWGMGYDNSLNDAVRVTIIATGFGLEGLTDDNEDTALSDDQRSEREFKRYYKDENNNRQKETTDEKIIEDLDSEPEERTIVDLDGWDEDDLDEPAYRKK